MRERYQPPRAGAGTAVAAALAAALTMGAPLVERWEGLRLLPYRDPVGIPTVCYGETQVAMRRHSRAECHAMLRTRLRQDFMLPILHCVPTLAERPAIWSASGSLAYNIGVGAFCRSSIAAKFRARRWREGCARFAAYDRAGGRVLRGLTNRRQDERAMCLKGAA